MAKYSSLAQWLTSQARSPITLTFAEVSALVPGSLPPSAYQYQAWWANERNPRQVQKLAWSKEGWSVASLNLTAQRVTFERSPEGRVSATYEFHPSANDENRLAKVTIVHVNDAEIGMVWPVGFSETGKPVLWRCALGRVALTDQGAGATDGVSEDVSVTYLVRLHLELRGQV
jgi:hypothetical protein